jgi:pimeloyl-ACP methyl ester carboxylesterase
MPPPVTDNVLRSPRHTSFYLSCGWPDAVPIIFVHGWPELSISWRHQLTCFGSLGFLAIAPDMRGYGRSSLYSSHADYAVEQSVADMLELLDHLGRDKAIWVGHDWGSPVVWSLASHHPERCFGVVNLCVPYLSNGFALQNLVPLVDRSVYSEAEYPFGQWEYQRYYQEHFDDAVRAHEANVVNSVKVLFRRGSPDGKGKPGRLAAVRRDGGWFGGAPAAPDVPLDTSVIGEAECSTYAAALERNGFFGPDAWYMNADRNAEFAARAHKAGRIDLPVLFLHGEYDYTCETVASHLADPMRRDCTDLTEAVVHSGHWMAQEQPVAVNAATARWLAQRFPLLWRVEDAAMSPGEEIASG